MKGRGMLAGVLALAVLAAGCGSDSEQESGDPLTKTQFAKQAESICTQAQEEKDQLLRKALEDAAKKSKNVSPEKRQEEVVLALLTPFETMTEELSELSPPEGDEDQVEEIIAAFDATVAELRDDPEKALGAGSSPFAKPDQLARAYGLDGCSTI